jgi:hypothetical protein
VTLPVNIKLGWKLLRVSSTLAYNIKKLVTAVMSFKILAPGANILKLFIVLLGLNLARVIRQAQYLQVMAGANPIKLFQTQFTNFRYKS